LVQIGGGGGALVPPAGGPTGPGRGVMAKTVAQSEAPAINSNANLRLFFIYFPVVYVLFLGE
jgi:hypothetical protein